MIVLLDILFLCFVVFLLTWKPQPAPFSIYKPQVTATKREWPRKMIAVIKPELRTMLRHLVACVPVLIVMFLIGLPMPFAIVGCLILMGMDDIHQALKTKS
jgi:hypothetical protein